MSVEFHTLCVAQFQSLHSLVTRRDKLKYLAEFIRHRAVVCCHSLSGRGYVTTQRNVEGVSAWWVVY